MSSVKLLIVLFSGLSTLSFTLSELKCQHAWSQVGSRCFRIFTTLTTWNDAEQNCVIMGGHLASVHNIEEYTLLKSLVLSATGSDAQTWLGATDIVQEGVWVWRDESPFDYTNWESGQPDNYLEMENCLEMNFPVVWNDAPCTDLLPSACAKSALPVKTISVMQLKIISKKDFLNSDIEELVHQVKQRLMDIGMPSNYTLRLKNIYKKPT